ncbi:MULTISPECIES: FtsH protease activity modulator HflK [Oleiagrimonas]|uniref:Protein HflK n=1 Tax=Oleiagrimonas citrea TaxID=1665687 RepID=A0A846ZMJ6_9GAMM|nr:MULTISPECIES: FtsH protease activity modulator HflK [Oleiagrimonas]NKZ38790.1 FtsH protease activity modulator HflK [Oleiagrimonas citrea]RAP59223.1 HflK protein [Oleiagrimonas sp. MCCC 1A03011]
MAWNEPGGGKQRDPWGRNNGSGGNGGNGPDFEKFLKQLRARFGRFGRGGGGLFTIIVALLLAWVVLSSYTVIDARQVGVVLRFGQYSRTLPPGFHLKLPAPIEHVSKVFTTQVRSVSDRATMLTNDENIVSVDFNVQYQVSDARKFLFSMTDPDETLKEAAEAAVRSVVGNNNMDTLLSGQGAELVAKTREALQSTLDGYHCGIVVTEVSFQNVSPPDQVRDAFDDVNKAREDKQRIENEAQAYASQVVPVARGAAARIAAEAAGYKAERIARATGDTERFKLLLAQYRAAPQVTRERLWLETMESVLANNPKVFDGSNGRNMIYLPVDKLFGKSKNGSQPSDAVKGAAVQSSSTTGGGQ